MGRLYGFEDLDIKTDTKIVKHHKIEFKMTAGTHEAIVICKNKREGKQRAAQKILKSIHPQLNCWGALLKLYGQGSCKTSKEKKVTFFFIFSSKINTFLSIIRKKHRK